MKKLIFIFVAICSTVLASCGISSDEGTETMIQGTWITEDEDDEGFYNVEELKLKKATHSFVLTLDCYDLEDGELAFTVTVSGSWIASSEAIEYKYNTSSIKFTYPDALTKAAFKPFESVMKSELEKNPVYRAELVTANWTELIEKDEDGELTVYSRPEKD